MEERLDGDAIDNHPAKASDIFTHELELDDCAQSVSLVYSNLRRAKLLILASVPLFYLAHR